MKAQSPKKKEKERNNNKKKKKEEDPVMPKEGSRSGQSICSKDLDQTRGHAARISIRLEDMQQKESTSRPYVCSDPHKGH